MLENEKSKKPSEADKLQCDYCDFQTSSKQGLKTHMKRKHTTFDSENFPIKCEFCEKEQKNNEEMKEHMITHSYKDRSANSIFKCEECNFWGPNDLTMKVHYKKSHAENLTCGLCNFEVNEAEDLEMHLFTCEIFKCNRCDKIFKSLPEVKVHINDEYKKTTNIIHCKMNRNIPENVESVYHNSRELFRKS